MLDCQNYRIYNKEGTQYLIRNGPRRAPNLGPIDPGRNKPVRGSVILPITEPSDSTRDASPCIIASIACGRLLRLSRHSWSAEFSAHWRINMYVYTCTSAAAAEYMHHIDLIFLPHLSPSPHHRPLYLYSSERVNGFFTRHINASTRGG